MTLYLIVGPPAGGKTTWVREHARHQDVVIDYDAIAVALAGPGGDGHQHATHVKTVTKAARTAAITAALQLTRNTDIYLIHSNPSDQQLAGYRQAGAQVVTVDPGRRIVRERAKRIRAPLMLKVIDEWYETHPASGTAPPPSSHKTSRDW